MTPTKLNLVLILIVSSFARSATLPSSLSQAEVEKLVEIIGLGANSRIHRSAEAYVSWPGIKFGVEGVFVPSKNINSFGNQDGTLPPVNILPRIHIAKGIYNGFEGILQFFPLGGDGSLTTFGLALKWTALTEKTHIIALAPFAGLTKVSGLGGYNGSNYEFGVIASKDLKKYKPYAGASLLFASAAITDGEAASENTIHLFGGVEIELPLTLSLQMDFMNLAASVSFLISKKF